MYYTTNGRDIFLPHNKGVFDMIDLQKRAERQRAWQISRRKDGWRSYTLFGPVKLIDRVKELLKQYKAENPSHYKRWQ
jgi:hypothetical protein